MGGFVESRERQRWWSRPGRFRPRGQSRNRVGGWSRSNRPRWRVCTRP